MGRRSVAYIMGRGHSGSTVLDALVANSEDAVGVGELAVGMNREGQVCSCGAAARGCPFWSEVRVRFEDRADMDWEDAARRIHAQAHIKRFPATLLASRNDSEVRDLAATNAALLDAIAVTSGRRVVVESSKELTRALFQGRFLPDTRLVHLVRSPLKTMASHLHRIRSGHGFPFLRRRYRTRALEPFFMAVAAVSWVVGNVLAEIVRWRSDAPVLRVRYEDLCGNPSPTLLALGDFIGCDLREVADGVENGRRMAIHHQISGNRMRKDDGFVFQPDKARGRDLPWYYSALAWIVAWPLMWAYGYGRSGGAEADASPRC